MKKFQKGLGGVAPIKGETPRSVAAAPAKPVKVSVPVPAKSSGKGHPIGNLGEFAHPPKRGRKK